MTEIERLADEVCAVDVKGIILGAPAQAADIVRAVLTAMRESSDGLLTVGLSGYNNEDPGYAVVNIWQAMIDWILAEG